jgi:hypothetical protein
MWALARLLGNFSALLPARELRQPTYRLQAGSATDKGEPMFRMIATLFAAFALVATGAFAQGSETSTKTETKSDTMTPKGGKVSKNKKKMKKAKKADGSMSKSTTSETKTDTTTPPK